jgi:hypothetical protein
MDNTNHTNNGYYYQYTPHQFPYNYPPVVIPQIINSGSNLLTLHLETQNREIIRLRESLEQMKKEFDKLKEIHEVALKDIAVSNNFIDNTIEKFKLQDEINSENENQFKTFNSRINNIYKKVNQNNKESKNKVVNNDIIENKIKNKSKVIQKTNDSDINKNNKIIKDQSHTTVLQNSPPPFYNFLSQILDSVINESQNTDVKYENDLIDSDDEINNDEDVYVSTVNKQDITIDKDITNINIKIDSIQDLIQLGKEYKINTPAVNEKPNSIKIKERDLKKNKNMVLISRPLPPLSYPITTLPLILPISRNQEEEYSEESDEDCECNKPNLNNKTVKEDTYNIYIKSKLFPPTLKLNTENPIENKNRDEIKYYTYGNKKYNIDMEKIVNLIDPLTRLENTIGMSEIKTQILEMILYYIQGFERTTTDMLHTSIEGPPGVGKSKLGRILAHIYHALGVIPSKRFKRVRRTDLIGKYLGHTAHKTQEVIDEAEGGILFIDEAYSLGSGNEDKDSFAKECIDTINMNLTEKKKNLIVIVAGYTDQLDKSFFSMNEGLRRRFPFRFTIKGYDAQELTQIFYTKIKKLGWKLDKEVSQEYLETFFKTNKELLNHFGGDIETIVLNCKMSHAKRIIGLPYYNKKIITKDDFSRAFEKFKTNKNKKEELSDSIKHLYM